MTNGKRKQIADELLDAAKKTSCGANPFCCWALEDKPALPFFKNLFEPRNDGIPEERRWSATWMIYYFEGTTIKRKRQDRVLALLLTREIILQGERGQNAVSRIS